MKSSEYYKNLNYKMVIYYDPKEKIYFVEFPELAGCITEGETEIKALEHALKVKDEWIQMALDAGWTIPEPTHPLETSGRVTFRPPKSIHKKLLERAEEEGVSLNQLILTYVSEGLERANTKQHIKEITEQQGIKIIQSVKEELESLKSKEQHFQRSFFDRQSSRGIGWGSNKGMDHDLIRPKQDTTGGFEPKKEMFYQGTKR